MSKRPIIGITLDHGARGDEKYALPMSYAAAVERAGGVPFMLPFAVDRQLAGEYVNTCDGFLLSGGDDLDPQLYGQAWHPHASAIDSRRQGFEMAMLAEIERRRRPVLGICLGSQLMNVARGGSLHQFLPDYPRDSAMEHRRQQGWSNRHAVQLLADSIVATALGGKTRIEANSSHKQAVDRVGRGLRIIATAPDGVVEGIEDPTLPLFVGVQWHPERMIDEPDQLALFQLLIDRSRLPRQ